MTRNLLRGSALLAFICILIVIVFYVCLSWDQANEMVFVHNRSLPETPLTYQEVEIISQEGFVLGGWFLSPSRQDGASILFLHGRGGNRSRFDSWARIFAREGYGVLLIDLRPLSGDASDYVTMGVREADYAIEAFNFLKIQDAVNPERIAIFGHSMGAATAILATARIPSRVLIASAAYTNVQSFISDRVSIMGFPPLFVPDLAVAMSSYISGADYSLANPLGVVADIHQPSLYLNGDEDDIVPVYHSELLYGAANEPKELVIIEGANHEDIFNDKRAEYLAVINPFLAQYLTNN